MDSYQRWQLHMWEGRAHLAPLVRPYTSRRAIPEDVWEQMCFHAEKWGMDAIGTFIGEVQPRYPSFVLEVEAPGLVITMRPPLPAMQSTIRLSCVVGMPTYDPERNELLDGLAPWYFFSYLDQVRIWHPNISAAWHTGILQVASLVRTLRAFQDLPEEWLDAGEESA